MAWSRHNPHLLEAFDSDESFLSVMKRVARSNVSKPYREPMTEEISHPDQETLGDYVDGILSNEETVKIAEHLAECRLCVGKSLRVTRMNQEMREELLEWANTEEPDSKVP